ncbi:hypothetical protein CTEN210_07492 [Chaetoceros tenuissimus]|uniref:Exosome complex component RRP45 n=1 Tax=Chaetoceros tenuissimus TaxID=426638 RepID=A0AAD3H5G9_9STRA|nr:hypothetical protein CTEN210_07492 [Chaetoceros tenuissimus]
MSASTTYTPLRDDTSYRSMSSNERSFIRSCATGIITHTGHGTNNTRIDRNGNILRTDGRSAGESRPIRMTFSRSHNVSECTVQFGANTRVSSVVTCQLIPPPHLDRPNDGSIAFSVDLSPMSAMGFEYVQPASTLTGQQSSIGGGMGQAQDDGQKLLSNRILRIMERTLLNGGAIDAEALCVQSGKWVWRLMVDVTVLDHGGNLVDACVLSAIAALRHFRKPEVEVDENGGGPSILHSDEREPTPLPLHHSPLTVTFGLYSDPTGASTTVSALVDPSHREELVMDGTTTFSFNKYGEICSLDFPGGCELKPRQLVTCATLGKRKCVELCEILEKSLTEADQKAIEERLSRLKLAGGFGSSSDVALPEISENVPFAERTDMERDGDMMEVEQDGLKDRAAAIAAAEEESYRINALDYAQGHVAAKVKEDDAKKGKSSKGPMFGGSLMAAMLKSAGESTTTEEENTFASDLELKGSSKKSKTVATSSSRTQEADDEFEKLAQEASNTSTTVQRTTVSSMDIDSDEEETTVVQSEFVQMTEEPVVQQKKSKAKTKVVKQDDDDDVDDLAMAVKSKSKKKKSKKSKK